MCVIGVTGSRDLTAVQEAQVRVDLCWLLEMGAPVRVHVGDARGVDDVAWGLAIVGHDLRTYHTRRDLPGRAACAERSTRMVRALAAEGGVLHAWPNKPAPPDLRPSKSWPKGAKGSGTWGTISLAYGLGVPVVIHPLVDGVQLPEWVQCKQGVLL